MRLKWYTFLYDHRLTFYISLLFFREGLFGCLAIFGRELFMREVAMQIDILTPLPPSLPPFLLSSLTERSSLGASPSLVESSLCARSRCR